MGGRFVDFRSGSGTGRIRHATVGAFKGLERRAVVVAGIDEIESMWMRQQLYVACTRSTAMLTVVLPERLEQAVAAGYRRAVREGAASTEDG